LKIQKVFLYFFYLFLFFDFISCQFSFLKRKYTKGYHFSHISDPKKIPSDAIRNDIYNKNNRLFSYHADKNNHFSESNDIETKSKLYHTSSNDLSYRITDRKVHINEKTNRTSFFKNTLFLKNIQKFKQDTLLKKNKKEIIKMNKKSINRTILIILFFIFLLILLYLLFYYVEMAYDPRAGPGCFLGCIFNFFPLITIFFIIFSIIRLIKLKNYSEEDKKIIKRKVIIQCVLTLLLALLLFLIFNATIFAFRFFGYLGFM